MATILMWSSRFLPHGKRLESCSASGALFGSQTQILTGQRELSSWPARPATSKPPSHLYPTTSRNHGTLTLQFGSFGSRSGSMATPGLSPRYPLSPATLGLRSMVSVSRIGDLSSLATPSTRIWIAARENMSKARGGTTPPQCISF